MFTTQPEKTSFIEKVALLVSQKGLGIEKTLVALNKDNDKNLDFYGADGEEEPFSLLPTYSTLWSSSYSRPAGISLEDLYIMKLTAQFIARVIRPYLESLMRDGGGIMSLVLPSSVCWTRDDDYDEPELIDAPSSYEILEKQLTLKELGIIKLTAMFVARYGSGFRRDLMEVVSMNPLFEFLRSSDCKCSSFFTSLVRMNSNVIMPSDKLWYGDDCTASALEFFSRCLQLEKLENREETAAIDLHALLGGVDCFSHMSEQLYLAFAPQPERLSNMVKRRGCQLLTEFRKADQNLDGTDQPDAHTTTRDCEARPYRFESTLKFPAKGITVKELGVIMLTAQLVAQCGEHFRQGLRKFGFMIFGDRRHDFYCGILCAYSRVVRPCKRMKKSDAYTDTVLEVFSRFSNRKRRGIGLHDFAGVVDSFAHVEDEEYSVVAPAPVHVLMNMIPRTLRLPDTRLLPPFVVRYGTKFTGALARRVAETTQFEFMNPTSGRLAEVLKPYKKRDAFYQKKKRVACMNTVLEGFFGCLDRFQQEQEEAVGVASHGFVDVVDCFVSMDRVLTQHLIPPASQVHLRAYGQPSPPMDCNLQDGEVITLSFVRTNACGCGEI
ncbi:hypothetical protein Bca52824_091975 [Brassica carinata]|uniref:SURP motif domain-containing protein n=1 Tax=Brassica carinata TaxID=52824 RepID=A0A8X7NRQ7_BRACI|nr:hypothetical protein Bca52824_091975 [Brassica carinata]